MEGVTNQLDQHMDDVIKPAGSYKPVPHNSRPARVRNGAGWPASPQKKKNNNWLDSNDPMEEWQLWVKEN